MAWVLKMDDATIESGLVHDFDASLSGIGQELGAGAYSMRLEPGSRCLQLLLFHLKCTLPVFPIPFVHQRDGSPLFAASRQPFLKTKYHKDLEKTRESAVGSPPQLLNICCCGLFWFSEIRFRFFNQKPA